jgi:hypothetical protein
MTGPYTVLSLDEIDPISVAGVHWKPLRRTLGIDAFGINAYTAAADGEHEVEDHTEETLGHQERSTSSSPGTPRSRSTERQSMPRRAPWSTPASRPCAAPP